MFSVLNADPEAAKTINGAAYAQALVHDTAYAQHPDTAERPAQLDYSATLRGLVDVGIENNYDAHGKNQAQIESDLYKIKLAFDYGLEGLNKGAGVALPGVGGQVSSEVLSTWDPH